jgi:2-keto-4-pentenoate hydratase/2-oxohepta-3-ene-1,7-dioic acid hydratase (catechol pathway)
MTDLTFDVANSTERVTLRDYTLVIAGFTGRNQAEVQHHIDELVAIGVPAPESVPAYYPLETSLLSSAPDVEVHGANSSGEVEPVLIRHNGRLYLTVGSDHTDRDLERDSIAVSKAACPKPVGRTVVALPEGFDWDSVGAACIVDGKLYQKGTLASLRVPTDVLAEYSAATGNTDGDLIMFGGTLPLIDGQFVAGTTWELSLELPDSVRLTHTYTTHLSTRS